MMTRQMHILRRIVLIDGQSSEEKKKQVEIVLLEGSASALFGHKQEFEETRVL
jgi:hypothetical protein